METAPLSFGSLHTRSEESARKGAKIRDSMRFGVLSGYQYARQELGGQITPIHTQSHCSLSFCPISCESFTSAITRTATPTAQGNADHDNHEAYNDDDEAEG